MKHYVLIQLRLPHILLAFLVGAALSMSGHFMQITINNPLADPYILGTSSAASLGANLVFYGFFPLTFIGLYMPQVMAFVLSVVCTFAVVIIARQKMGVSSSRMLLAGIAMSSLLTSIIAVLAFTADSPEKLRSIIFWVMGSFEHADWPGIGLLGILVVFIALFSIPFSKHLNLLIMGKEKAHDLGLNSMFYHRITIILAIILASVSVTLAGAIGFVGLMIPHVVRGVFGVSYRLNVVFCALTGGTFMVFCDWVSKLIYPPVGMPIGIITSLFGVPFFVYLLLRKNYKFE